MTQKICLHGLGLKSEKQLLEKAEKVFAATAVKNKIKEKNLSDNDLLRYRSYKLRSRSRAGCRATCICGVMVAGDKLTQLSDIILEYEAGAAAEVRKILLELLDGKIRFVLEEPDLELRVRRLRSSLRFEDLPGYDEDSAATALCCHLPRQLYDAGKSWGEWLSRPGEKPLVRQLRVKLRRLRSSLDLFRPLLPERQVSFWRQNLREWNDLLAVVREYDVALLACARVRRSGSGTPGESLGIENALRERRRQAEGKALAACRLNKVTAVLAEFLLGLQQASPPQEYAQLKLKEFLRLRFAKWCDKLAKLPEKYDDWQDMAQLHRIRIRVRRFRYALQGAPELACPNALLRSLKSLQDILGLLHDNYVNDRLTELLMLQYREDEALLYDGAMLRGWEKARTEAALPELPEHWKNFCRQLADWREENL